ncbi:MAG: type II CRISPR-associated endonuclease Cas1 [Oscillospiraceae bacterium]|nr:type II CRISPR-associated endonuclease Cas1 [Oscillospiraceae bacterium]
MHWRTLIISSYARLEFECGNIIVTSDETTVFPICEIKTLVICSQQVSLTCYLLNELAFHNVKVIFCDKRKNPSFELCKYYGNTLSSDLLEKQISWNELSKAQKWQQITVQKLDMQSQLLNLCKLPERNKLRYLSEQVELDDRTNREGYGANIYFKALFGNGFARESNSTENAALNYGYTILLSMFNRSIVIHGYNTELGIHHCNKYNHFNLSCDIMEPFRPFVDRIVYENRNRELDSEYKMIFISLEYQKMLYNGKKYEIGTAIDMYTKELLDNMNNSSYRLKEMGFIA